MPKMMTTHSLLAGGGEEPCRHDHQSQGAVRQPDQRPPRGVDGDTGRFRQAMGFNLKGAQITGSELKIDGDWPPSPLGRSRRPSASGPSGSPRQAIGYEFAPCRVDTGAARRVFEMGHMRQDGRDMCPRCTQTRGGSRPKRRSRITHRRPPDPEPVPDRRRPIRSRSAAGACPTPPPAAPARLQRKGEEQARLYFTAYTLDGDHAPGERPLTIAYNGGPGSASVWLHLGGLAPKRVEMLDDGGMPQPPFSLVDNEYTWLTATDLVFVDPVDTGYSRATSEERRRGQGVGATSSRGRVHRLYLLIRAMDVAALPLRRGYGTFRRPGSPGCWSRRDRLQRHHLISRS